MERYSVTTRNEILTYATIQIDIEKVMLSEISQVQKDKHCMISFMRYL